MSCKFAFVIILCCSGCFLQPAPNESDARFWQGMDSTSIYENATAILEQGRPSGAVQGFRTLFKKYPLYSHNLDVLLILGRIYSEQLHDYPSAIETFSAAVRDYPDRPSVAHAYFMLGYIYSNYTREFDEARKWYEFFLKKFPEHELAVSVRFELENIGKDVDQILLNDPVDSLSAKQ